MSGPLHLEEHKNIHMTEKITIFASGQICLKFYVYDGVTREGRVAHATFYPSASQTTLAFKFTFNSCKLPSL